MRSALNSSVVWELTTEGERPFHCGIVRGKMSSSWHHCMPGIYNIGTCVMQLMFIRRRMKLFNIGSQTQRGQLQYGGGGGYCQMYIYAFVHMHMYAKTYVKYSYTHTCMHTHVCMHAQPLQTYILHPNMKVIKNKSKRPL